MSKVLKIVVDSDAIIAQNNESDPLHKSAMKMAITLAGNKAQLIYPASMVAESTAYMQRVLNSSASAYGTAVAFTAPGVEISEVDKALLKDAVQFLNPNSSKKNTLFDCIVAATAKKYQADAIFSYDKFYKKLGFKLASELDV